MFNDGLTWWRQVCQHEQGEVRGCNACAHGDRGLASASGPGPAQSARDTCHAHDAPNRGDRTETTTILFQNKFIWYFK